MGGMIVQVQKLRMPEALSWILAYSPPSMIWADSLQKAIGLWEAYIMRYSESPRFRDLTVDFDLLSFDMPADRMALFKLTFAV